jgi:outer membrane receptor protein involved in Fe transport
LDYYNIRINNAITEPYTLQQIVTLCEQSNGTSALCGEITRPTPTSFPTAIAVTPLNVASLKTKGLDLEIDYGMDLGPGRLNTRVLATYVLNFEQQQGAGQPDLQLDGTALDYSNSGLPKFRGLATVGYDVHGLRFDINERVVGQLQISHIESYLNDNIPAVFYTDANAAYTLPVHGLQLEAFVHVDNLFNKQPPLIPFTLPGLIYPTQRSLYDIVGTALTFGIRGRF